MKGSKGWTTFEVLTASGLLFQKLVEVTENAELPVRHLEMLRRCWWSEEIHEEWSGAMQKWGDTDILVSWWQDLVGMLSLSWIVVKPTVTRC